MDHSWGHAIRFLTDEEKSSYMKHGWTCSSWCPQPVEMLVTYHYVTGSSGRTSFAERRVCRAHGMKFAERYGCCLDAQPLEW